MSNPIPDDIKSKISMVVSDSNNNTYKCPLITDSPVLMDLLDLDNKDDFISVSLPKCVDIDIFKRFETIHNLYKDLQNASLCSKMLYFADYLEIDGIMNMLIENIERFNADELNYDDFSHIPVIKEIFYLKLLDQNKIDDLIDLYPDILSFNKVRDQLHLISVFDLPESSYVLYLQLPSSTPYCIYSIPNDKLIEHIAKSEKISYCRGQFGGYYPSSVYDPQWAQFIPWTELAQCKVYESRDFIVFIKLDIKTISCILVTQSQFLRDMNAVYVTKWQLLDTINSANT